MRLVSDFALAIITIWQEARGEPQAGRVAVGEVIRNRMKRIPEHRRSVAVVVLSPYQFSGYNTKDPNRTPAFLLDDMDQLVRECAQAWIDSAATNITEGATHYLNPDIVNPLPKWAEVYPKTVKIGRHQFYVESVQT